MSLLAGATQTNTVPVAVLPAGQPCGMQVFLTTDSAGTNIVAMSAIIPFTSTDSQQLIAVPVVMPAAGTYYPFVDVYINGIYVGTWPENSIPVISADLGGNMTTQNVVTASRVMNQVYQNTTGKPMFISFSGVGLVTTISPAPGQTSTGIWPIYAYSDSSPSPSTLVGEIRSFYYIAPTFYGLPAYLGFWVLPGNYYEIYSPGNVTISSWVEYY